VSILILSFYNPNVFSAQITLTWDPNTEPDLAGYKVYYGAASGVYKSPINVGKVTAYTLTGLPQGQTLFVSVTAYDTSNRESEYSNEVSGVSTEPTQAYTVTTHPSGLQITVDGTTYTAPQSFRWEVGSAHTVSVSSPQAAGFGARYVYSSWSDGGQQSHTITAPSSSTTYTASFITQYSLTTSLNPSAERGVVTPSGVTWYTSGQSVSISARANPGYSFGGWLGDLSGTANPSSITMKGSKDVSANFSQNQYTLTINVNPSGSGSVTKNPNKLTYAYGDRVTLTVTPNFGYNLSNWSGDAGGTSNPVTLTIDEDKTVIANVTPAPGSLLVTPSEGLVASGNFGGPFSPFSQTYTLLNTGGNGVEWRASKSQNWISLSLNNGSLASAESKNVVVSINKFAKRLMPGTHTDIITFSNATNGNGDTPILVALKVSEVSKSNNEANTDVPSIDGSWIFEISGMDKGGAALWFMGNTLYGYGISLGRGMFEMDGSYDIDSKGSINGTYTLYDFESLLEVGNGNITGKAGKKVTKLNLEMNTANEEPLSIKMKGGRFSEEPVMPNSVMARITGSRAGTIAPLKIEPSQFDSDIYPHLFKISGPGIILEIGQTEMEGCFFVTQKKKIYGIYQFGGIESELGAFSGKLNPASAILNLKVIDRE